MRNTRQSSQETEPRIIALADSNLHNTVPNRSHWQNHLALCNEKTYLSLTSANKEETSTSATRSLYM